MGKKEESKYLEEISKERGIDWNSISFHYTDSVKKNKGRQDRYFTRITKGGKDTLVLFVERLKVYLIWDLKASRHTDYSVIAADVEKYVHSGYVDKGTGFLDHRMETVYIADKNNVCDKLKFLQKK